jgi:RNA polymerase sigma-70 factor (ECF subfamily)
MSAAPQRAEELFNEYSGRIYAYCLRQLGSPEEAEDALQATYLNACRSLLGGFEPDAAQAWLFKVAQNVCLTRQRSRWRRSRVERAQDMQEMQDFVAAPEKAGDDLFGIEEALAALPDQQRRAILLREWQGLSYREVAAELGVSQAAVETLIFRARRSLAAALEQPEEAPRRAGALRAGALLGALKSSLGANLSASLATGLAVAASATTIAASPIGHVVSFRPPSDRAAQARDVSARPTSRPAPVERFAKWFAPQGPGHGKARGKVHRHGKPSFAGRGHGHHRHGSYARGKPSWAGSPPAHSHAGGNGAGHGH